MTVTLNTITLTVTATSGNANPRDFVGIFRPGTPDTKPLVWKYLANNSTKAPPKGVVTP